MVQQICIPHPKLDTVYSIFKLCAGQKFNQEMHPCLEPFVRLSAFSCTTACRQMTDCLCYGVEMLSPLKSTVTQGEKDQEGSWLCATQHLVLGFLFPKEFLSLHLNESR